MPLVGETSHLITRHSTIQPLVSISMAGRCWRSLFRSDYPLSHFPAISRFTTMPQMADGWILATAIVCLSVSFSVQSVESLERRLSTHIVEFTFFLFSLSRSRSVAIRNVHTSHRMAHNGKLLVGCCWLGRRDSGRRVPWRPTAGHEQVL